MNAVDPTHSQPTITCLRYSRKNTGKKHFLKAIYLS